MEGVELFPDVFEPLPFDDVNHINLEMEEDEPMNDPTKIDSLNWGFNHVWRYELFHDYCKAWEPVKHGSVDPLQGREAW